MLQLMDRVFTFTGLIGAVAEQTAAGLGDSERALEYEEPWEDDAERLNSIDKNCRPLEIEYSKGFFFVS